MKAIPLPPRNQQGAAAVEFALIAMVFFILLIGVVEMGRILFTWNAATEATRYGARVAVVCDIDQAGVHEVVVSRMQRIMPNLPANKVLVEYFSHDYYSCNDTTTPCRWVRVSIQGFQMMTYIPAVGTTLTLPNFYTTLPRESMSSTNNAICS